tara:strand:- start:27 stop:170 length:144 start_codon:yes stop_codon:yes gene_type:complete
MEIIIGIVVLVLIFRLGKYCIEEGVRVERQKKFMEDVKNWDKKNKKK